MEIFVPVTPKLESETVSLLTCKFCLAPQSAARLTWRDLTPFFCVFRACGLGLHIMEPTHYNWVCQYCWVRATQCVNFIECALKSEHVLNNILPHTVMTEEKLRTVCENYITRPVDLSTCINVDNMPSDCPTDTDHHSKSISIVHPIDGSDALPVKDEYYDVPITEEIHLSETVLWPAERSGGETVKKTRRVFEKPMAKQPRKDPAELRAKWSQLEFEVIELTEAEQLAELESKRLTQRYLGWRHKCEKCAIGFHELEPIEKHMLAHEESRGPYICNICQVRFAKPQQLSGHTSGHRRRWRCLRCGDTIVNSKYLMPHHAACTGSPPVPCELCGKLYSDKLRLRKHISMSHKAKHRYACDVCGQAFRDKHQIKYHIRTHTREKPFECTLCGKRSSTTNAHRVHMKIHEKETNSPELFCVECNKYFKNKYILRMHFKKSLKHVSRDTYPHGCTECEQRYRSAAALRIHVNTTHLDNRSYACPLCDKSYYTRGSLTAHTREKHTPGERTRDHLCSVCSKTFGTSSLLKAHSRMHTKERPYVCLVCPATFSFNASLYTHTKIKHKMTPAQLKHKLGIKKT